MSASLCLGRAGRVAAVKLRSHKAELICYSAETPRGQAKAELVP